MVTGHQQHKVTNACSDEYTMDIHYTVYTFITVHSLTKYKSETGHV